MQNADHAQIREGILALFRERKHDIKSPYALYDHPKMWNLFEEGEAVTAVRPAVVMERVDWRFREVEGIGWGRHVDGAWIRDEQHCSGGWDHFIDKVMLPALERGARLVAPDLFPAIQAEEEPAP